MRYLDRHRNRFYRLVIVFSCFYLIFICYLFTTDFYLSSSTDVTILEFRGGESVSTQKRMEAPTNLREICDLNFDCLFFKFNSRVTRLRLFSAIMTYGSQGLLTFRDTWEKLRMDRDPRQMWIAESMESSWNQANYAPIVDSPLKSLFNWTFFVSRRATFQNSYFQIIPRITPLSFDDVIAEYRGLDKSRDFCWLVSNCEQLWTDRSKLGMDIISHLPTKIHMWGTAASTCMKPVLDNVIDYGRSLSSETSEAVGSCKFYFAFENSKCTDYVTEKFSRALDHFAVPIVNGFKENYETILPGSTINPDDFDSYENLGKYLKFLLKNETAFFEYHRWRTRYQLTQQQPKELCRMCEKLSEMKRSSGTEQQQHQRNDVISDLEKEFKTLSVCDPPVPL